MELEETEWRDDADEAARLLVVGANVHADDDTALRAASQNGGADVVEVLLKAGADVHAKDDAMLRAGNVMCASWGCCWTLVRTCTLRMARRTCCALRARTTLQKLSCCPSMAHRRTGTVFTARKRLPRGAPSRGR